MTESEKFFGFVNEMLAFIGFATIFFIGFATIGAALVAAAILVGGLF